MYAKEEIPNVLNSDNPKQMIPALLRELDTKSFTTEVQNETSSADSLRIYIEPEAWTIFYAFRALCGRVSFLVEGQVKDQALDMWYNDAGVREILAMFMDGDEVEQAIEMPIGGLNYVFSVAEAKLLQSLSNVVLGTVDYKRTLKQIEMINNLQKKSSAK